MENLYFLFQTGNTVLCRSQEVAEFWRSRVAPPGATAFDDVARPNNEYEQIYCYCYRPIE